MTTATRARELALRLAGCAFLAFLSLGLYAYQFELQPNVVQVLPFAEKLREPALYPGDAYVATLERFPSAYPRLLAWAAAWLPLATLHWLLYLALKIALLWAAQRLAESQFGDARAGWLAAALFALSPLANILTPLGEDPLYKTALYHTSAAGPLILWSLHRFLREDYPGAFGLLAAVHWLNPLFGNFLALLYACVSPARGRKTAPGWTLWAILCLPWALRYGSGAAQAVADAPLFLATLREWHAGHYFPSAWSPARWERAAASLGLLAVLVWGRRKSARSWPTLRSWLAAILGLWLAALAAGEWLLWPRLVLLQLLRSDVLFIAVALPFAAEELRSRCESGSRADALLAFALALALVEFASPFHAWPVLALLLAARSPRPLPLKAAAALGAAWALGEAFRYPVAVSRYLPFGSACALLLAGDLGAPRPAWLRGWRCYAALLALTLAPYHALLADRLSTRFAERETPEEQAWKEVQRWAERHTPVDSLFIVPPDRGGFRVLSKRPVWVEWIDGAAMHWAPGFEKGWRERLAAVGFTAPRSRYETLGEREWLRVAGAAGASYLVTRARLRLPLASESPPWRVYALRDPAARTILSPVKDGRWLEPRYTERGVFEKDYPGIDMNGLDVYCPGCRRVVRLGRKSPNARIGGWCKACNRGVTA